MLLLHCLDQTRAMWLLSYNDCEEVRRLYWGYHFFRFERPHSMAQRYRPGATFHEILISNYDVSETTQLDFFSANFDYEKRLKECVVPWIVNS